MVFSALLAILLLRGAAVAADISTHTFAGCNFPDTGQSLSYTGTFGEDHDYYSSVSTPSYTVYNPVGLSSVTVDNRTGLMWVTNPATDAAMGGTYSWEGAIAACEGLSYAGYGDWRLPNVRELLSIVDYSAKLPAVNTVAFPGTLNAYYWSSTTTMIDTSQAWPVHFEYGKLSAERYKFGSYYVRCVRGGP